MNDAELAALLSDVECALSDLENEVDGDMPPSATLRAVRNALKDLEVTE